MSEIKLNEIIDLLQEKASRPLSLRDIQEILELSAGERKQLGKFLKALVKEGTLVQLKGGRFSLPRKVNLVVGVISVHRDGYGFVTPASHGGDDVYIPARNVRPAMHGDTVVVRLERSAHSRKPEGRVIRVESRAHRKIVGRYQVENGVGFVMPVDQNLQDDLLVAPGGDADAVSGQMVLAEIVMT